MFTVDLDDRQYLVTAKHVVESASGTLVLDLFHEGSWKALSAELVGHAVDSDVSVLAATRLLTRPEVKAEPSSEDMVYGQETYFLGFPYGLFGDYPTVNNGYPLPFVKKATLSMIHGPTEKIFFLDGINNVGFSGGPVAFKVVGSEQWRIAGVVSGYVSAEEQIALNKKDTGLRYAANTGLIRATPIEQALELIRQNPKGMPHN